ncbi:allantoate permease [Polychaeton citri CBS 116435]|uniref:Allantoate permease n=1 Tax=Polychaeton citri CBS 116435 TaxID=1314669 RepID=A0A9P4Q438_9PEZI|nr:allantoate permease [Polychaeton citri CBS 116435]
MTVADERALVRKIDKRIIPLMFACYSLQYLDKTLVNYANVMGLQKDTNTNGNQFSELALIFYVSYLAFELPTGYLMQRLPTAKYLGINVALWGAMVCCTSATRNFGGLVTVRLLLGVFESAVAPALILISSMWYKRSEQPLRIGLWYVGIGVGTMVGSICSFGFQHYHGSAFKSWQIMFLVFGLVTVMVGILVFFILPDNPMSSSLDDTEKIWAIERLRENQTGIENKHFKWAQALECLKDPQTWLICLLTISSNVPNGAVTSYQATIIKSFGYTSKQTALLSIPSGAVSCVSVVGATWAASRYNFRGPFVIALLSIGIISGCLLAFDTSKLGKLIGNYLTNCIGASLPLLYSWVAANYAGHTKKVTMNAILLMSFCLGNIIGPLTFNKDDAPGYLPAKITIVVTTAFAVFVTLVLMAYYFFENKRRDRLVGDVSRTDLQQSESPMITDLTDKQNMNFRYCL